MPMEKKKQDNSQNFKLAHHEYLEPMDLAIIQNLAFHQVFEPFEVNFALKLIREARVTIENKISPVLQKVSKLAGSVKSKAQQGFWKTKQAFSEMKMFNAKKIDSLDGMKKNYNKWESKIKNLFFTQLDKGISLVFEREFENLIIQKAKHILDIDLENIVAIQRLPRADRIKLLENLYPFELTLTGKIRKSINQTSNILLGLVVASNIPLTGGTVNLITTFKSVIYLSNRLHLLSSIYGYPIICKEAIFLVSTKIISSIIDYESNAKHKPLNPQVIGDLYQYTAKSSLMKLLKKSTIKDLYISVPLVGSLSLAKITLDEQSITKLTLQLVRDYFDYQYLAQKYTQQKINQELKIWYEIYLEQKKSGWIKKILDEASKQIFKQQKKSKLKEKISNSINFEKKEQLVLQKIHQKAMETYNTKKQTTGKI